MRLAALAAVATLAAAPLAAAQERRPMMFDGTLLTVVAEGRATEKPDLATLTAGVMTRGRSAEAALADNARQMTALMGALRAAGIAERDVQTAGLNVAPEYAYEEGRSPRVTGYQAHAMVQVRVRDVAKVGKVIDSVVANGSNQLHGVMFGLAEPDAALDRARVEAIKKARARADIYAGAAGLRVQRIVSISEAGGHVGPPMPMVMEARAASAPATPIAPGELDLSAPITIVFELK